MIEKILVGTSTADDSDATLDLAAELATSNDAELVVLELKPLIDARQVFDPDGVPERRSAVRRLQTDYPALRIRTQEAPGNPLRTVVDVAEDERPDLIVVGQSRSRRSGALLSRRAGRALVERASGAVLLVAS